MDPIERHIKQHFDSKSYPYNEAHWLEAQKLIAENKKRRRGWLYWWTGAVSAMLILTMAFGTVSTETQIVANQDMKAEETTEIAVEASDVSNNNASALYSENNTTSNKVTEFTGNSKSDNQKLSNTTSNTKPKIRKTTAKNIAGKAVTERNLSLSESEIISNETIEKQGKTGLSGKENFESKTVDGIAVNAEANPKKDASETEENSSAKESSMIFSEKDQSELAEQILTPEEIILLEKPEEAIVIEPINPVAKLGRFGWGFVAGYLVQNQFGGDKWLNGAYAGGRASWVLSSKWSVGADVSAVIQEMNAFHFHHDVQNGYSFGRDSLVTDMYAKRAISLQIPISVSYAIGKHTFSGMIGTRILLDAQASMQKLHYSNTDPENAVSGAIVPRSRVVADRNEIMPEGALSPFSIYSGVRYGWMIGKGWGLETNVSMPLYHKKAKLDLGSKMAADQGIRIELGVLKVF